MHQPLRKSIHRQLFSVLRLIALLFGGCLHSQDEASLFSDLEHLPDSALTQNIAPGVHCGARLEGIMQGEPVRANVDLKIRYTCKIDPSVGGYDQLAYESYIALQDDPARASTNRIMLGGSVKGPGPHRFTNVDTLRPKRNGLHFWEGHTARMMVCAGTCEEPTRLNVPAYGVGDWLHVEECINDQQCKDPNEKCVQVPLTEDQKAFIVPNPKKQAKLEEIRHTLGICTLVDNTVQQPINTVVPPASPAIDDPPIMTPPAAVCGNGIVEGSEACDDGNLTPSDGCDEECENECAVNGNNNYYAVGSVGTWYGKVNVHRQGSAPWTPAEDCDSGSLDVTPNDPSYCQGLWPATTHMATVAVSAETKPFTTSACAQQTPSVGKEQYLCCVPKGK